MKLLRNPAGHPVKSLLVCSLLSAMGATPLVAQFTDSLAHLAGTPGATLTIGDKIFSGFSYNAVGLTTFDANLITVTASESGGVDYLSWTGSIALTSGGTATADLLLRYVVTANPGKINMIDQAYTGSAQNGFIAIDETASIGAFGGTVVGFSHLEVGDFGDPPAETVQGDTLIINPPQSVLYVTKDIGLAVFGGGAIEILRVEQSFHQVPEPNAMVLGGLGGGMLLLMRFRRQARD